MERNRILELALKELERQKAVVSAEIEELRSGLKGTSSEPAAKAKTAAARKAQSLRMKKYWAEKRAKAVKKALTAKNKARAKTAAEKKALSLKMKEVWRKRKAEAAKKKG